MKYSIEAKDLTKTIGNNFAKNINKNLSSEYSQKLLDCARKYGVDAIKAASKKAIQKTVESTGDSIGNNLLT